MTSEGQPPEKGRPHCRRGAKVRTQGKVQQWWGGALPGQRGLASRGCLQKGGQRSSYITFLDLSFFNHKIGDRYLPYGVKKGQQEGSSTPLTQEPGMLRAHLCQDEARKKTHQGTLGSSSAFWCFNHLSMYKLGFPAGTSGKEPACQCRRHKRHQFNPWVGEILWRRSWQPTPVFLPGESHGQRSLASCSPWGQKESDTTEAT